MSRFFPVFPRFVPRWAQATSAATKEIPSAPIAILACRGIPADDRPRSLLMVVRCHQAAPTPRRGFLGGNAARWTTSRFSGHGATSTAPAASIGGDGNRGMICDRCGVKVTTRAVRRERFGHINLLVAVPHDVGDMGDMGDVGRSRCASTRAAHLEPFFHCNLLLIQHLSRCASNKGVCAPSPAAHPPSNCRRAVVDESTLPSEELNLRPGQAGWRKAQSHCGTEPA